MRKILAFLCLMMFGLPLLNFSYVQANTQSSWEKDTVCQVVCAVHRAYHSLQRLNDALARTIKAHKVRCQKDFCRSIAVMEGRQTVSNQYALNKWSIRSRDTARYRYHGKRGKHLAMLRHRHFRQHAKPHQTQDRHTIVKVQDRTTPRNRDTVLSNRDTTFPSIC